MPSQNAPAQGACRRPLPHDLPHPDFWKDVPFHCVTLALSGISDLQGRGCGLHTGGVGPAGAWPEGAVLGRDAGELPEPSLPG